MSVNTDSIPNVGFKKANVNETSYGTGAHRDGRVGKGKLQWLPWDAVRLVSHIYETGNIGRSDDGTGHDRNWERGISVNDFIESAMNHYASYLAGDRSEPHLCMAVWNGLNAIQTSIWVHMGWRPASLNKLVNQRGPRLEGNSPHSLFSEKEIEWLKVHGLEKKDGVK